jgi:two-component sensor histidine kinase/PAS domain-containing protein
LPADASFSSSPDPSRDFAVGGGELGALIRSHDWSATSLGPIETWPQSLKTITSMLLMSPVPIVLLWGEEGIMIYNDAYSVFAGGRHPRLLGSRVREGWPEVADFNDNVMKVGLSGGTLAYKDQELTLYRHGRPEQVWMNLDYSPVLDESGRPAGVIAIVVETSERVRADRRLLAERERLSRLFEQAPGLMAMLSGPDHVFEFTNPAYRTFIGEREVLGLPIREALPEVVGQGFVDLLDDAYRSGRAFVGTDMRITLRRTPGGPEEERSVDFVFQPVTDDEGVVTGIFVEGHDATERRVAEDRVRHGEERFRALVNATSEIVFRMSRDGSEMQRLDGRGFLTEGESDKIAWLEGYLLPEEQPSIKQAIAHAVRSRAPLQLEHRIRRSDGTIGWISSRAIPLLDGKGEIVEWFGAASDVTERKRAEEHLRLVANELNHRVKNNLAMTQALAVQTFRNAGDLGQAQASFLGRIMALAQANDLLTGERWVGASLGGILEQAVRPQAPEGAGRLTIAGPEVQLTPKTALSLSLAVHELGTNALKYGAWSTVDGSVSLTWERYRPGAAGGESEARERIRLEWRETGGPPVSEPSRRGFGSRLVERGLAAEMGGEVAMEFRPEGLRCLIDAPLPDEGS